MIIEIILGSLVCIGITFITVKLYYEKLQLNRLRRKYNESENKSGKPEDVRRGTGIISQSEPVNEGINESERRELLETVPSPTVREDNIISGEDKSVQIQPRKRRIKPEPEQTSKVEEGLL